MYIYIYTYIYKYTYIYICIYKCNDEYLFTIYIPALTPSIPTIDLAASIRQRPLFRCCSAAVSAAHRFASPGGASGCAGGLQTIAP